MGLLSSIFDSEKSVADSSTIQEVEVHFTYGSTNFQHLFALEDLLGAALSNAAVGVYEGHDVAADGSNGHFYIYGPDAEAIQQVIVPLFADFSFMRGAKITMWFGPRKWRTPKRVIQLPI
jgi:hypothetical protein